jgi:hypothetical protein
MRMAMLRSDDWSPLVVDQPRATWEGWSDRMETNGRHGDHEI